MRILHLADLHIKLTGPRAAECRRILDMIPERSREAKPDAIVIAGDLFDAHSTEDDRLYLAGILEALSDVAPVYAIHGNHDSPKDVALFDRLDSDAGVATEPKVDAPFAFLPWPKLGILAAAVGPKVSIAERREIAKAALIDVLRGFRDQLVPGKPSLLIAHMPVIGASMDSGQPVSGGEEIALTADELLESGAAGVALGHVHLRQQMRTGDGRPVWYSGAPFRANFGESSGEKGGLLWDWVAGAWKVTPWDLPARKMILVDAKFEDGKLVTSEHEPLADAEVRLKVEFLADQRETVRGFIDAWKDLNAGPGSDITVDERPISVSRTRCAEIEAARTTADKLAAWAKSADQEIPEGSAAKLSILEEAVQS
jgi:DNA repair exonuclease SbcCD nuclease subunit